MIKAILFDFNGVIIDDERIQMRAYQDVLKSDGIDLTEDEYFSCLGMDDRTFVSAAFERVGKTVDDDRNLEITLAKSAKWREMVADELPLFDGIADFVRRMSRDFALGVVSMARREEIEFVLEKSGLRGQFAILVTADEVSKCKPDPESYLKGFAAIDSFRIRHGHSPMTHADCLAIEDSPPGIVAGRTAGLKTLGVTNTVSAEQLREAGADAVTGSLRDWMPDSARRVFV
jgi:HAD superfamily hydrolase (TIGR01509 family)